MKTAIYKLAGDVPEDLKGAEFDLGEAETDEELLSMVEDKNPEHVRKLAQQSIDIVKQRLLRSWANSEEIGKFITARDMNGAVAKLREWLADYKYGSVVRGQGGGSAAAKAALEREKAAIQEAQADPAFAERLRKLGYNV